MDNQTFEKKMRELEYFHSLRLLPGTHTVIRADGRSFSKLTSSSFDKPFDLKFHELMVETAKALLSELDGIYAYTESDEISVLFPPDWDLFDQEFLNGTSPRIYPWNQSKIENLKSSRKSIYPWDQSKI